MFKKIFFSISFLLISLVSFSANKKYLVQIEYDLYIYNEKENSLYRLTYDRQRIGKAIWSPDGKHIVYAFSRSDYTSDLVILDEAGQELCRMSISPLDDSYKDDIKLINTVKKINKIEWREDNSIISYSKIAHRASAVDIWQVDSSFHLKHIKRIDVSWTYGCEISPKKDYLACKSYSFGIIEEGKVPEEENWLSIHDLSKKYEPEDTFYEDPDPKMIDFEKIKDVKKIEYISDNEILLIVKGKDKDEYYIYNIKEEKFEKINEKPKFLKQKNIPMTLKFKVKGKEYNLMQQGEIFDYYEMK